MKIVDFGIATQAASVAASSSDVHALTNAQEQSGAGVTIGQALTQAGALIGTPAYMAPEQISGLGLDQRADQYALGCILYELCTKELPFNGPNLVQLLNQHLYTELTPMRKRYPHLAIPQELDDLVTRLLAKEPAGRFASIQEVENELVRLSDRYAPGGGESAAKGPRWPLLIGAAVVSGALLVSGTYVAMRAASRAAALRESPLDPGELAALRAAALEVTQWFLASSALPLRLAAIVAIGQLHDEATLPLLLPLLFDPQPAVQAQAAEVIGQIGEPTAAGALVQLLATPRSTAVEAAAGVALDRLGDARGRATLAQLLKRPEPEAQFRAALALCQHGDSAATERLQSLLSTMNAPAELEQRALGCLALRGDDAARQRLLDKLRGPLHPKLKLSPAGELAQLGDAEARKFLHELASTPGPQQLLAGQWVSGAEEDVLLKRSREVLADPGAELNARALAAGNLGTGGDLGDVRRLVPHLRADSADLSLASAAALLQLSASDPSLLATQSGRFAALAASAGDWSLRQSAATVFGDSVKGEDALAQLLRLQGDGDARVRRGVARALGRRPEYAALLGLQKLLRDADRKIFYDAWPADTYRHVNGHGIRASGGLLAPPRVALFTSGRAQNPMLSR